jgi:hypothetical protein
MLCRPGFLLQWAGVLLLGTLLLGTGLSAQGFRATIKGRITDASGAVVPGAKVTVLNQGTQVGVSTQVSATGDYTVPLLQPGTYTVSAEATGFKRYVRPNIVLNTGQVAGIDIAMQVGEQSQAVEVTATAPVLDTQTANQGLVISGTAVTQLPLNGRNPFMLAQLSPGVNYNGSQQFQRPFDNGAIANWSINGGLQNMNEFLLDGAPNNAQAGGNNLAMVPPVDSVAEFKVQTSTYDAEFGKTAGGIVSVTTKSGTAQYHGDVYDFLRRTSMDALTPAEIANSSHFGTPNTSIDHLTEYGGSLGGPVHVPWIDHGQNKTFFFFDWEHYYQDNPQVEEWSMPTLQEMGLAPGEEGVYDFSGLNNPATDGGTPVTIYNPYTTAANGTTPGAVVSGSNITRSPLTIPNPFYGGACPATPAGVPAGTFSCNTTSPTIQGIPSNMVNPIALAIAKYFPSPNQNGVTALNATRYGSQDYGLAASANPFLGNGEDHFYNFMSRLDQDFGPNNHLFLRVGSNDRHQHNMSIPVTGVGANEQNPLIRSNFASLGDWTSILSPTMIADMSLSYAQYIEAVATPADASVTPAVLGFANNVVSQIPNAQAFGIYGVTNYQTLGHNPFSINETKTWAVAAKLINDHGAHSLKYGVDLRWINENFANAGNTYDLSFGDNWTQQNFRTSNATSGDGLASLLLGLPTSFSANNLFNPSYLTRYFAFYAQDDWRVSSRLSLNLGLRWDFFPGVTESHNALTNGFASNTVNPANADVQAAIAAFTPTQKSSFDAAFPNGLPSIMGGLNYVPASGGTDGKADWTGIQPRFGLAYQVTHKLVFRAGAARYMVNPTNDWYQNPPQGYSQNISYSTTALSTGAPVGGVPYGAACTASTAAGCSGNLLSNPFAILGGSGLPQPTGKTLGPETSLGNSVDFFNPSFRPGWVLETSAGIEYGLTRDSRIQVSYDGNRGYKLETDNSYNVIPLALRQQCDPLEGGNPSVCQASVPNPFYNLPEFAGSTLGSTATTTVAQLSLPYPEFTGGTESGLNLGRSWYNSLQVTYTMRASNALTLTVAYTHSNSVERGGFPSGEAGGNQNTDAGEAYTDVQKGILEEGPASYNLPNVLKVAGDYDLPFGTGRRFGSHAGHFLNLALGGWEYNTVLQYNAGHPWNLPGNIEFFPRAGTQFAANLPVPQYAGTNSWHGTNNVVQGVRPCVGVESASGAVSLEPYSTANGNPYNCALSNINFLSIPSSIYAPLMESSLRTNLITTQPAVVADMSLAKTFDISERFHFQFRAEGFNIFNTPWLSSTQFSNNINSASFGTITKSSSQNGSAYPNREIQIGLKLMF